MAEHSKVDILPLSDVHSLVEVLDIHMVRIEESLKSLNESLNEIAKNTKDLVNRL